MKCVENLNPSAQVCLFCISIFERDDKEKFPQTEEVAFKSQHKYI